MAKRKVNEHSPGLFEGQFCPVREKHLGRIERKALKSVKTFNPLVCRKPSARHFEYTK